MNLAEALENEALVVFGKVQMLENEALVAHGRSNGGQKMLPPKKTSVGRGTLSYKTQHSRKSVASVSRRRVFFFFSKIADAGGNPYHFWVRNWVWGPEIELLLVCTVFAFPKPRLGLFFGF